LAEILTAIVAVAAYGNVLYSRRARRVVLERYLEKARREAESQAYDGSGIRNIVHLMGNCRLTEAQVLEAAFASRKIRSWVATDGENGADSTLMFQLNDIAWRKIRNSN